MMKEKNIQSTSILISLICMTAFIALFFIAPIAQDITYHSFVDQQSIQGIANFWNVLSNLPFFLVGLLGLYQIFISEKLLIIEEMKFAYVLFFLGVAFVALGSGYYHLSPDNETLVWDRLPMTIAFMALFSIVIAEYISVKIAKLIFWPLLFAGIFSVLYWSYTESIGEGDLRLYVLVQFLPILIIPLILSMLTTKFSSSSGYWWLLAAYVVAKLLEYFDGFIYTIAPLSGHSLKHMAAALGIYFLLQTFNNRHIKVGSFS